MSCLLCHFVVYIVVYRVHLLSNRAFVNLSDWPEQMTSSADTWLAVCPTSPAHLWIIDQDHVNSAKINTISNSVVKINTLGASFENLTLINNNGLKCNCSYITLWHVTCARDSDRIIHLRHEWQAKVSDCDLCRA